MKNRINDVYVDYLQRLKGGYTMATVRKKITQRMKSTEAQREEIRAAAKKPPVFDEDSPKLTSEQLAQMAEYARKQRELSKKPVIALRISPDTLVKAKATGKGYTGFLSRLLDNAINDPDMVSRSL